MKYYDFEEARRIIEKEKSKGICYAYLGMAEDWFWTAGNIWKNGEYNENLFESRIVAGIEGSFWATPILRIYFEDGSSSDYNCYYHIFEGDLIDDFYSLLE